MGGQGGETPERWSKPSSSPLMCSGAPHAAQCLTEEEAVAKSTINLPKAKSHLLQTGADFRIDPKAKGGGFLLPYNLDLQHPLISKVWTPGTAPQSPRMVRIREAWIKVRKFLPDPKIAFAAMMSLHGFPPQYHQSCQQPDHCAKAAHT